MPKLNFKLPSYRLHKATGQAVVALDGRDVYVGPHGTPESRENYERLIQEWLITRRRRPVDRDIVSGKAARDALTISELFAAYWEFAQGYYRKNGKPTSEVTSVKRALTPLLELYGHELADNFGPLALKACRERMIEAGLARGVINKHIGRTKRFFKWATENELVRPDVYNAIRTVAGLRRGRSPAPESNPVRPVADELVDATLPTGATDHGIRSRRSVRGHLPGVPGIRAWVCGPGANGGFASDDKAASRCLLKSVRCPTVSLSRREVVRCSGMMTWW